MTSNERHAGCQSSVSLDHMMTTAERRLTARAKILDERGGVLRLQTLVPGVVDHDAWRPIARAQAFDLDERKRAGRVGLARTNAERLLQLFGDALRPVQRAGQRAAHLQHEPPDRLR